MKKEYIVRLKKKEQKKLTTLVNKGVEKARKIRRARILLLSNLGKTDVQIAEMLGISLGTVAQVRRRYVTEGFEASISERPRSGAPKKWSGKQKAKITALACSNPPEGRSRWTLRLLSDKVVELNIVDDISYMGIDRILKKTN
jgi:transposase